MSGRFLGGQPLKLRKHKVSVFQTAVLPQNILFFGNSVEARAEPMYYVEVFIGQSGKRISEMISNFILHQLVATNSFGGSFYRLYD